jgi:hypothetical protein
MPLSRHFYSLDEVQAALLYTTTRSTPTEALFWSQEMILSGCIGEAISTLFQSWLWFTGPMRLQWLVDAWKTLASDELSEDDILLATYRLGCVHHTNRDNSLWNILVLTTNNPDKMPDRVTKKTPVVPKSLDEKEMYFMRAIFQGKAQSAWWISKYLSNERVWELLNWYVENVMKLYKDEYTICLEALKGYEKLLGYKSNEYDIIVLCMAVIMMCIWPSKQDESFSPQILEIDKNNGQILNEWSESVGRRDRRVYQIPKSCLYGTTLRGRSKWTHQNFTQLYNIEKYLVGCPFWDEVLEEYANVNEDGEIQWKSDEDMELFYEKYFPDDIPDEWSKSDQEKSHGDGVLGPTDKITLYKYTRNFMIKMPYLAWNTSKQTNTIINNIESDDCSLEKIVSNFIYNHLEDLKQLSPVTKLKLNN